MDDHNGLTERMQKSFLLQDASAIAENYSEHAVLYGPNGEVFRGRDNCRQAFVAMFEAYEVLAFDWDDFGTQVGDYAYHWGSWTWRAKARATGQDLTLVARTTDVRNRVNGHWQIVLDHASIPVPVPKA